MDTKGACILVVNNDLPCNNVVSQMLRLCSYQVLHVGSILDALNAIWETKNRLDLVLTNAHKLESNGTTIIEHIQKKLNLPVVLMSTDETKIPFGDQDLTFGAYFLKGLTRGEVNTLWKFSLGQENEGSLVPVREEHVGKSSVFYDVGVEKNETCAAAIGAEWFDRKRKRKDLGKSKTEGGRVGPTAVTKKPRVVWTREMHQKFLEAIEVIGYEKAVPKKIVEVMGIPGLSRENVASHLQKFRGSTKRAQDIERYISAAKSYNGTYVPNELKNPFSKAGEIKPFLESNGQSTRILNFVGYRFTDNGNSISLGSMEDENGGKKCFSLLHQQDISAQPGTVETGNDFQVQNLENFSLMAQCFSLLDHQDIFAQPGMVETGNDFQVQISEEFSQIAQCFSLFDHQDISAQPGTKETGNDFQVHNSEEISQLAQCIDDFLDEAMVKGGGGDDDESWPFDWEEFFK